jgi:hypothetical protein
MSGWQGEVKIFIGYLRVHKETLGIRREERRVGTGTGMDEM